MPPYRATSAALPRTRIHLALLGFADEVVGTLARLFAYVGTLALLAILLLAALGQLPSLHDDEPSTRPGWSVADRSYPAFAVSRLDSNDKTNAYIILRHPEGGRKDVMRWVGVTPVPVAELEIYRPGAEFNPAARLPSDMAARMGLAQATPLEEAGVIDSKFGPVALFRPSGQATGCLGYVRRIENPSLQISGWSCQGDALPARRAAIACTLNRLTLLTSGNEPKLAELFAHAELKRRPCGPPASTDWLMGAGNAQLRGAL
ncbi:hypothetical protein [Bradyrhizobium iriomotense]|uniref:Uncharacterized protein n=1 Tax=Bradyrhizobium iriomotense TaxID=441950 RepID=A0ABQ6B707_9BRAD|nr:hypothetical protein [Bradyrhizobium iriomotense]GLR90194.1 hypothetical protein GCM10007857_69080 [Bradyrhizobium iriomotense]